MMEPKSHLFGAEVEPPLALQKERRTAAQQNLPPKLKPVNRDQSMLIPVDVEALVGPDHKVRAIWELTGRLELSRFRAPIVSAEGCAGRPRWDPRLLVSVWVYAYSEGISSAREIGRMMEHEPGLMWLAGLGVVNHSTLSDFRVDYREALEELFTQLLAVLEAEGVVKLDQVMHDGTKIRAQAGADSFRREGTLQRHLERARQVVEEMGDPKDEEGNQRRRAARQRAARERLERLEQALQELEEIRRDKATGEEKAEVRVSLTEPEARVMKHGDNAIAPSYNVQISTDAEQKIVVGVRLTQSSSDSGLLGKAMEVVEENLGRRPARAVADGGYTDRSTIAEMAEKGIDFIGSLGDQQARRAAALKAAGIEAEFGAAFFMVQPESKTLQCPAGKRLQYVGQSVKRGNRYHQYRAQGGDCPGCEFQPRCCPKNPAQGRTVSVLVSEPAEVATFRQKMETEEAKRIYKQRGAVAEFPNAWIKDKLKLRKFCLRGIVKAGIEAMWACLTYNVMQWMRLNWRKAITATALA